MNHWQSLITNLFGMLGNTLGNQALVYPRLALLGMTEWGNSESNVAGRGSALRTLVITPQSYGH